MLLEIFEKMVLTAGMMLVGNIAPAATATKAAISAYSTRSCPSCLLQIVNSNWCMANRLGSLLHIHLGAQKYNTQRSNDRISDQETP